MRFISILTNAFPLWILLAGVVAFIHPPFFIWFSGDLITYGLGIIMLGMGLTLSLADFKRIIEYPLWILTGVCLQFMVMPFLGWGLGYLFHLSTPFSVGLILVACCPGGTASNVISFLAKANVALSVSMTAISTLFAVVMTPILTTLFVENKVDVNTFGLLISTFKVVILPITIGIFLNKHKYIKKVLPFAPLIAVILIVLIVASIIGAGRDAIISSGLSLFLAIFCLHTLGFLIGYFFSFFVIRNQQTARTISIEVGMQNSGLGVVLARTNFVDPLVAIPSAISSLFHSLIGSVLAAIWRKEISLRDKLSVSSILKHKKKYLPHTK